MKTKVSKKSVWATIGDTVTQALVLISISGNRGAQELIITALEVRSVTFLSRILSMPPEHTQTKLPSLAACGTPIDIRRV
jgi:hypothetical protein